MAQSILYRIGLSVIVPAIQFRNNYINIKLFHNKKAASFLKQPFVENNGIEPMTF